MGWMTFAAARAEPGPSPAVGQAANKHAHVSFQKHFSLRSKTSWARSHLWACLFLGHENSTHLPPESAQGVLPLFSELSSLSKKSFHVRDFFFLRLKMLRMNLCPGFLAIFLQEKSGQSLPWESFRGAFILHGQALIMWPTVSLNLTDAPIWHWHNC